MLMPNKKSLTERVLELKKRCLQPANIMQKVKETAKNVVLITITSAMLLGYATSVLASEPPTVKEYIQQNNYNLSSIFQLYLKPLNENGLDNYEKEFIDLLQGLPENKQKNYAKEVYDKSFTTELLEEIKKEKIAEKPVTIDDKVTTKPENPVDIYAVIAVLDDAGDPKINADLNSANITYTLSFYWLLKNLGVSDKNIDFFVYRKHTKDIINTDTYYNILNRTGKIVMENALTNLPHNSSDIVIDYEKFNKKKVLKSISNIESDDNDYVYILLDGHGTPKGKIGCLSDDSVGWISGKEVKQSIKDVKGTVIIYGSACYSEKFIKNVGDLNSDTRRYVGIASSPSKEIGGLGALYNFVIAARANPKGTVEEIVKEANKAVETENPNKREHPVIPNVPMVIYPASSGYILFWMNFKL